MTIVNIRGTSGSGKSTLVRRFLDEHSHLPVMAQLSDWKKEKVVAYKVYTSVYQPYTYVMGRYETQCGGWDAISHKGSHQDLSEMIEAAMEKGNVIFEGLTISSSISRWLKISQANPGQFIWCFMDTELEVCHQRILSRNGGREPKQDKNGLCDYHHKYRNCVVQAAKLKEMGERVEYLSSDDTGYQKLLRLLNNA